MIRKVIILLISLTIIFSLIFIAIKDKLNVNKILKNIENDTGIKIDLKNNQEWSYYPKISYQNNLSLYGNENNLIPLDRWLRQNPDDGLLWTSIWKLLVEIKKMNRNSVVMWSKKCLMIRRETDEINIVIYPTKKKITRFISASTVEGKVISELLTSFKKQPNDILELIFLYNRPIMMDLLHIGSSYYQSLN